jgi:hypothetical protein
MKMNIGRKAISVLVISIVSLGALAGDDEFSGYLGKEYYDQMEKQETQSGLKAMRWVNPKFNSDDYDSAIIDDVVFYPKAEPSEQVSEELLDEMQAYLTEQLKARISSKVKLVDEPQRGAVRASAALTGVKTGNENMKPYEILPIGAVLGLAKAATGKRDQDVHVFLEVKVTDSMTGDVLVAIARELEGEQLENKASQLTLKHVQGSLDKISGDAEESLNEYIN